MKLLEGPSTGKISLFRIIWLSTAARNTWAEAIRKASRAVEALELSSVQAGVRECCTRTTAPAEYFDFMKDNPEMDIRPLRRTKRFQGFSHRHEDPAPEEAFFVYSVIGRDREATRKFEAAYRENDHVGIGRLLGFPDCCGQFFSWVWPEGYIDPIWQMASGDAFGNPAREGPERIIELETASPFSNPLLRYLGIRLSYHIPHSFNCQETIARAQKMAELLSPEDRTIVQALLSMPMEWDVNHEIAQIKTPIFWLIINSVPTEERYRVRIKGDFVPREGS